MNSAPHSEVGEERQSLWLITASPALWAAHFLASYMTAAVWCGKAGHPSTSIDTLRVVITATAVVALVFVGLIGRSGWRRWSHAAGGQSRDRDTPEDRHRFLGFATLLLSGLSAIAIVFTAIATLLIRNCV